MYIYTHVRVCVCVCVFTYTRTIRVHYMYNHAYFHGYIVVVIPSYPAPATGQVIEPSHQSDAATGSAQWHPAVQVIG